MPGIIIICNNRAEAGPLASVIAALPEATVLGLTEMQQRGPPAKVLGWSLWWFDREFEERQPDLVIVVGDRYETLGAVQAAYFRRIPVAHIHGGETTAGAFDDSVRHAITHMASLHFCATLKAKDKLERLLVPYSGPYPTPPPFHITGAPGLDGIQPQSARRDRDIILATFHPETMANDYGLNTCKAMLQALDGFDNHKVIFCGVNNDPGSAEIRETIELFCKYDDDEIATDLDHAAYIALMQSAALVIGNSSAAILEAPWVGVPSVNIGNRQQGREMAPSVIQAAGTVENIQQAVTTALSWNGPWNPCYRGEAAPRIAKIVREFVGGRQPVVTPAGS